jgi:S-formylglutathione hydrolase FrmB
MEELLPALEARHPGFGGSAAARSVAGLSMGGFGALNLASRTRAFGRCLALSPALVRAPFSDLPWYVRRSLTRIFPSEPDAFAPWNPWRHLGGTTELVIGCGMEDRHGLAATCRTFAQVCADRQRPLQLELSPGGHDWTYWTPAFRRWAFWLAGGPSGDSPGASRANRP